MKIAIKPIKERNHTALIIFKIMLLNLMLQVNAKSFESESDRSFNPNFFPFDWN